ncbi:hypothetical protein ABZV75_18450 [Streptomyces flaveolus]|uniref:hypothetical protein n=1 Tax=Streptomyces flaveolus TaxID=67297 RepID=UPI0033B6CB33
MRVLPTRRLASTALCAAVLVAVTGPAALAAHSVQERERAVSQAAVPGAEKLLAQVRSLGAADPALHPVVELVDQALKKGTLPADQAKRLGDAAKKAVAEAAAHPAALATPTTAPTLAATPTASGSPTTAATSSALAHPSAASSPSLPVTPARAAAGGDAKQPAARDLSGDLQTVVQAISNLVNAVTTNLGQVLPAATGLVTDLVGLITGILGGVLPTASASASASASAPSLSTG